MRDNPNLSPEQISAFDPSLSCRRYKLAKFSVNPLNSMYSLHFTPEQVLEVPILATICLLSGSVTIWRASKAIEDDRIGSFTVWLGATIALAAVFLTGTALEWKKLIYQDGLTISTNLFGTTF